jgi:phosphoglycolate phosphatase-like HAD superfamily hydrolase
LENNKNRYLFFIVSGTPQDELESIIRRREMDQYFCEVLGSPKSKETLLEGALSRLKLFPEETVFVGDAETDWSAAKKLGVAFLWRRVPSDSPLLTGYAGPQLISLTPLEENLKILQKEMTL